MAGSCLAAGPAPDARNVVHLDGVEAQSYARMVAGLFDLDAYGHDRCCVAHGQGQQYVVHFTVPHGRPAIPRVIAVVHGTEECIGWPPNISPELLERASALRR